VEPPPYGGGKFVSFNIKKNSVSGINLIVWLDVVTDGLIHLQLITFCQNSRLTFLGRNTPTPLISEILTQVDDTIVETLYRNRTSGGHVDWTPHLRKFANMKIQVSHFCGGFRITLNEGSAISAFYSATCALIIWLGSHRGALPDQQFTDTWVPRQDLTSTETGNGPFLQALSKSHVLLLQD